MFEPYLAKAMDYGQYRNLLQDLMAQGKTTGHTQSEAYLGYAKLNLQRMQRLEKTAELSPEMKQTLSAVRNDLIWLVITEGWCGDAAQNLPYFEKMEQFCPEISLKLILRDDHPELMDRYLTNGARSIPKLICLEKNSGTELFLWGPRPAELQTLVMEMKKNNVSSEEKSLVVQKWYNADKGAQLQKEFIQLIGDLKQIV